MDHFKTFLINQKRIQNISWFLFLLITISFFISLAQGSTNVFLHAAKMIVVGIVLLNLNNGKKWAVKVILIIVMISILQCIAGILSVEGIAKLYYIILLIGFIFIVKFLSDSRGFDTFFRLKNNNFDPSPKEGNDFMDLVKNEKMIEFEHRKITTPSDYFELLPKLFALCHVENQILKITHQENIFNIETSETLYELAFNNQQNIFDRNIIEGINFILEGMEAKHFLYFAHPKNILNQDPILTFVIGSKLNSYQKLVKNGYVLK
ncbi:MAG: hypothetical protein AB8F94_20610 [Saprospiraceae bacterium]